MAKRNRQIKKRQADYEISESIDDHLLPDAEEIAKYKEIDPEFTKFIRETAQKEQDFRHSYHKLGAKMGFREQILQHGINYLGLLCALCIVIAGLWFSRELLIMEMKLEGTIFGGAVLAYLAYLFIRVVRKGVKPPGNPKK